MKKILSALLTLMLLLPLMPVMADEPAPNPLPEEIAVLFEVPAWDGYHVAKSGSSDRLSWAILEDESAALVVMTNGSLHIVCLIERNTKGEMRITQRNYSMVIGDEMPEVQVGYGDANLELDLPWTSRPMFEVMDGGCYIAFGKFNNGWRIKTVLNHDKQTLSYVFNDKIGYVEAEEREDYLDYNAETMKYAYGVYDNRFAAFNRYDFPKTLEAARAKLTNPPVTPTDFYTPLTIELRADEKYDVFAAPGRSSFRSANGKAVMSTNDWVQIFGEEDGWLLVQYDISRDQMRFGYIDASALPKDTEVQSLRWYDLPLQTVQYAVSVTDDPLVSGSVIHHLSVGEKVTVLSSFGTWYYIETTDAYGRTLRGFIPRSAIDIVRDEELLG